MTKPTKELSAEQIRVLPIDTLRELVEDFDIVTTKEGAEIIRHKENEAEVIEYLQHMKLKMEKRMRNAAKIKSSKGKYPKNLTPKKKRRK